MHLIIDAYFPGYIPSYKSSVYTPEERELIRRLLDERPPILLMSAVHRGPEAEDFAMKDLKVEGFLEKPFKLKDLLNKVESLFAA